jgi:NodT family efflux transporter outer membrane factor (OMF) lipoprotein
MIQQMKQVVLTCSVFLLILVACKAPKPITDDHILSLPEQFTNAGTAMDTTSLQWRTFFQDPLLVALIDSAFSNNLTLKSALQRIEMAGAGVMSSRQALNPTVEGTVASSLRRFGLYTMDGAGNISTFIQPGKIVPTDLPDYYLGLQTRWEADIWGKLKDKNLSAVARLLSSVETRNFLITEMVAGIAISYHELKGLDQELKIVDETIELQNNMLIIAKVQKEAAMLNELAVKQFESQLFSLRSLRFDIQQRIVEEENRINLLLGRFPTRIQRDTILSVQRSFKKLQAGVPAQLLSNRPDIRAAAHEVNASKADLSAARKAFYPSLNITGSLGYQAFQPGLLFNTPASLAYGILGNLTTPLINRAALKAEFKLSNARQLDALYQYQQSILNGYTEVYNELIRSKNLEQKIEQKSAESAAGTASIEIAQDLLKAGRATYVEVLFAQQNLLKTKLELVAARKTQLLTTINLYKALGGGWQ